VGFAIDLHPCVLPEEPLRLSCRIEGGAGQVIIISPAGQDCPMAIRLGDVEMRLPTYIQSSLYITITWGTEEVIAMAK